MSGTAPVGRGRGGSGRQRGGAEERRELRRPMPHNMADDIANGMARMEPFRQGDFCPPYGSNNYLPPRPAPNADGWSSGENQFDIPPPASGLSNHQVSSFNQMHQQFSDASSDQSFNVKAPEFVPKSTLSVAAQEFVPRSMARNTSTWAYEQQQAHQQLYPFDAMTAVTDALGQMTYEPAKLDYLAQYLSEQFNANAIDLSTMKQVVQYIFETCLTEANFRYTGAKLCDYLAYYVTTEADGKTFRQILLDVCKMEHQSHKATLATNPARVRNFTLYMADLFLQMGLYAEDVKQRIAVLGVAVLELIVSLFKDKSKENLKTISQTLKMAGCVLEEEEKAKKGGASPSMDNIMVLLAEASKDPAYEPHMQQMCTNLVELRNSDWGGNATSGVTTQATQQAYQGGGGGDAYQAPQGNYYDPNGDEQAIYFTEDGQAMTYEEYKFLKENLGEESSDEGDMPDDVEAAFEEFLNQNRS